MDFSNSKKKLYFYITLILLLIIGSLNTYIIYKIDKIKINNQTLQVEEQLPIIEEKISEEINIEPISFFVDIKGAINNPGVYLVNEGSIVNEVINMAGGLKDNAYIKNINLSKSLTKEMVIIIYTKDEINKQIEPVPECTCNDVNIKECLDNNASIIIPNEKPSIDNKTKININTSSLEELMTLDGIGESKAKAIIEYRNTNGPFKSIEEIKNISGISEKTYEKLKPYIES